MRLAVLSESSADEAAIQILVGGILSRSIHPIPPPRLRTRGWPSVRGVLPTVLQHLHYQTNAEALALVVDSNYSPVHQNTHNQPGGANPECRVCDLRGVVHQVLGNLTPVPNRSPLKTAVGLAVPTIEAWLRCSRDAHVSEAAWVVGLGGQGPWPYSKIDLKQAAYGVDRPSLELETRCATEEAQRLAQDLSVLEQMFPGFRTLANDVRSW